MMNVVVMAAQGWDFPSRSVRPARSSRPCIRALSETEEASHLRVSRKLNRYRADDIAARAPGTRDKQRGVRKPSVPWRLHGSVSREPALSLLVSYARIAVAQVRTL